VQWGFLTTSPVETIILTFETKTFSNSRNVGFSRCWDNHFYISTEQEDYENTDTPIESSRSSFLYFEDPFSEFTTENTAIPVGGHMVKPKARTMFIFRFEVSGDQKQ
jgi:hypothetical protein